MKAWELLSDKSKWTTRRYAKTAEGLDTTVDAPDAACWCAAGAIMRCYTAGERYTAMQKVQNWVTKKEGNPGFPVVAWNDGATYEEVVAALKELDV
jgi:hypothetical protein